MILAEDGSGKGAGLVSAIAQRINERNFVHGSENGEMGKVCRTAAATNGINGHTSATNGFANGHSYVE